MNQLDIKTRIKVVAATVAAFVMLPVAAFATDSDTTTAVTSAATTLKTELLAIGTNVLPLAAAVLALSVGWRFARKFVKG